MKKGNAFISYSHFDYELISPIVSIIRAVRNDLVFQDTVDLKAGKLWEPQLLKALDEADIVLVFWCSHSIKSAYVKKEYTRAIKGGKDVLPVLLENIEMPKALSAYQRIDMSRSIMHGMMKQDKKVSPLKKIITKAEPQKKRPSKKAATKKAALKKAFVENDPQKSTYPPGEIKSSDKKSDLYVFNKSLPFTNPLVTINIAKLIIAELNKKMPPPAG